MTTASEILIAGAGIAGLSLAYELLQRGLPCRLLERDTAGRGTSWAAAGMLAPIHELEYQELELLHAGRQALATYDRWAAQLPDFGLSRCGALEIALTPDDAPLLRRHFDFQRGQGLAVHWLEGRALHDRWPALAPGIRAGIHAPDDGQVDHRLLINRLIEALHAAGIPLHESESLAHWQHEANGIRAQTASGCHYTGRALVLCTGVGPLLAGGPAMVPVRGQMVAVEPTRPPLIDAPLRIRNRQYGNAYIVPKADRWILGSTSEEMGYDCRPTAGGLLDILNKCYAALPALYDQPVIDCWAGLRPATASRRPIVDALEPDRVWVFNGLYRHGILLAPYLATHLADWIATGCRPVALEPFRT